MRYVSIALTIVLGIAAILILWESFAMERGGGGLTTIAAGIGVSAMLGLAAIAVAAGRFKARRLEQECRLASERERMAIDTVRSLDVIYSVCSPGGERGRFSDAFLKLLGCEQFELLGHAWLDYVHPEDRDAVLEVAARSVPHWQVREHVYCVRSRKGSYIWLYEKLSPLTDVHGEVREFVCTAFEITRFVETETTLQSQINSVSHEAASAKAKHQRAADELARERSAHTEARVELERVREEVRSVRSRLEESERVVNDLEVTSAHARDAEAEAERRCEAAQADAERVRAELDEVRKKAEQAAGVNASLAQAIRTLDAELSQTRSVADELQRQLAQQTDEAQKAQLELAAAKQNESDLRKENARLLAHQAELTKRVQEANADDRADPAVESAQGGVHPSRDLAKDEWEDVARTADDLIADAVDERIC